MDSGASYLVIPGPLLTSLGVGVVARGPFVLADGRETFGLAVDLIDKRLMPVSCLLMAHRSS